MQLNKVPGFYAQHGEDARLRALLGEHDPGFYIDIGAWEPELDSVTKHFYDRGWRGVNVEPVYEYWRKMFDARPRDINICAAVSNAKGPLEFAHIHETGLSTLHAENARNGSHGRKVTVSMVETITLRDICLRFAPLATGIDFLKIDVEGHEREVLMSNDWERFRPRIVVVEATVPGTDIPAWEGWDGYIQGFDYEFIDFDGLNRWYRAR